MTTGSYSLKRDQGLNVLPASGLEESTVLTRTQLSGVAGLKQTRIRGSLNRSKVSCFWLLPRATQAGDHDLENLCVSVIISWTATCNYYERIPAIMTYL